jgi:hypothetical protein
MTVLNARILVCHQIFGPKAYDAFDTMLQSTSDHDISLAISAALTDYFVGRHDAMQSQALACAHSLKSTPHLIYKAKSLFGAADFRMFPWIPKLQLSLSPLVSAPFPVSQVVKSLFLEFKSRHRDTWPKDRLLYSRLELDAISDLLVAPNYYA